MNQLVKPSFEVYGDVGDGEHLGVGEGVCDIIDGKHLGMGKSTVQRPTKVLHGKGADRRSRPYYQIIWMIRRILFSRPCGEELLSLK